MKFGTITANLCVGLLSGTATAQTVAMTGYRYLPGLMAVSEGGSLTVTWDGERGQELQARRRVVCRSRKVVDVPYRYLGADDRAGPNFTGQPAVDSHNEPVIRP